MCPDCHNSFRLKSTECCCFCVPILLTCDMWPVLPAHVTDRDALCAVTAGTVATQEGNVSPSLQANWTQELLFHLLQVCKCACGEVSRGQVCAGVRVCMCISATVCSTCIRTSRALSFSLSCAATSPGHWKQYSILKATERNLTALLSQLHGTELHGYRTARY